MFGRKQVMLLGHASRVVAVLALVISGNPIFLYVFAFFIGFSCSVAADEPGEDGADWRSQCGGEKRATAYATLMAISQGTSMIMASVGGYLAIVTGYWPIFAVTIVRRGDRHRVMAAVREGDARYSRRQPKGGRLANNLKPKAREGADSHLPDDGHNGHRLRRRLLPLLRGANRHLRLTQP